MNQQISVVRWILVPVSAVAGFWLALAIAFGSYLLGDSLCPANQIESGTCIAPWFNPFVNGLMFLTPSLAAICIVLSCTLTAPSHRQLVALLTLAAGSGYAVSMGRAFSLGPGLKILGMSFGVFGMSSAALSILVGGLLVAWLAQRDWTRDRKDTEDAAYPQQSRKSLSLAFVVVFLLSFGLSRWRANLSGPRAREVSPSDVPRLIQALESQDHPIEAAYALGRIGKPAAPAVPILTRSLQDKNRMVASGALFALGRIGPDARAAIPELKRLAVGDGGYKDSRHAILALAGIGDVEAIVAVAKVGDSESEHGVADAIREYELRDPRLEALLTSLFRNSSSDYVKTWAAIALASTAPQTAGLDNYLSVKLEERYAVVRDEQSRRYNAKEINSIRAALELIGTADAKSTLQRFKEERSN